MYFDNIEIKLDDDEKILFVSYSKITKGKNKHFFSIKNAFAFRGNIFITNKRIFSKIFNIKFINIENLNLYIKRGIFRLGSILVIKIMNNYYNVGINYSDFFKNQKVFKLNIKDNIKYK